MIDHVSIGVRDLEASARFYAAALASLGYARLVTRADQIAFGTKYPEFWLNRRTSMPPVATDTGSHICLRARSAEAIDAFHKSAIEHGGTDDGAPGPRADYGPAYYGAFARDLDGHKIEAMLAPEVRPAAKARRAAKAKPKAKAKP